MQRRREDPDIERVDAGQYIAEMRKKHNLPQVSFHRWKKQFGQKEINVTKRPRD